MDEVRAVPRHTSVYKLNDDGTYEDALNATPSVYIKDSQVRAIWNPQVASRIRAKYGPYVCVMHEKVVPLKAPEAQTFKYILGA